MKAGMFITIGLAVLLVSSCTVGSRTVVTEERRVSGFDQVDFSGMGELTITQGDRESLTIEAESNVIRRITTEMRRGTLHIGMRSGLFGSNVVPTKPIRYTLTMREITALDLSGLGSVYAGEIAADRLDLRLSGAGKTVIRSLNADVLVVEHSGVGGGELSGQVRSQEIRLSGAGDYDAADLQSETAEVVLSGIGRATVWASESLDAVLSGAGSVRYYGDPKVTQEVSGVGRVRGLGSR